MASSTRAHAALTALLLAGCASRLDVGPGDSGTAPSRDGGADPARRPTTIQFGAEVPIDAPVAVEELEPHPHWEPLHENLAMGSHGGVSLVAWMSPASAGSTSERTLLAARLTEHGPLDASPIILGPAHNPNAAIDASLAEPSTVLPYGESGFLIAWVAPSPSGPRLVAARVSGDGVSLDPVPVGLAGVRNPASVPASYRHRTYAVAALGPDRFAAAVQSSEHQIDLFTFAFTAEGIEIASCWPNVGPCRFGSEAEPVYDPVLHAGDEATLIAITSAAERRRHVVRLDITRSSFDGRPAIDVARLWERTSAWRPSGDESAPGRALRPAGPVRAGAGYLMAWSWTDETGGDPALGSPRVMGSFFDADGEGLDTAVRLTSGWHDLELAGGPQAALTTEGGEWVGLVDDRERSLRRIGVGDADAATFDGSGFLVAGGRRSIRAIRLAPSGEAEPLGVVAFVPNAQRHADVVFDGEEYVAAWIDTRLSPPGICARRLSRDGQPLGAGSKCGLPMARSRVYNWVRPRLAVSDGATLVVAASPAGDEPAASWPHYRIRAAIVGDDASLGPEWVLAAGAPLARDEGERVSGFAGQREHGLDTQALDVVAVPGGWLAAWVERDREAGMDQVVARRITGEGQLTARTVLARGPRIEWVSLAAGLPRAWLVFARADDDTIRGVRIDGGAALDGAEGLVLAASPGATRPDVAMIGTRALVVFRDERHFAETGVDLYGVRVDFDAPDAATELLVAQFPDLRDSEARGEPRVASDGRSFHVAWVQLRAHHEVDGAEDDAARLFHLVCLDADGDRCDGGRARTVREEGRHLALAASGPGELILAFDRTGATGMDRVYTQRVALPEELE